jgi:hypothetical protein
MNVLEDFWTKMHPMIPKHIQPKEECKCGRAIVWGVQHSTDFPVAFMKDEYGNKIYECVLCVEEKQDEPRRREVQIRQQRCWDKARLEAKEKKNGKQKKDDNGRF